MAPANALWQVRRVVDTLYDGLWAAEKAARRARDPMAAAFTPAAAAPAGQAVEQASTISQLGKVSDQK